MADVFISYKRQDRPRARQVAESLAAEGLTVWWDLELVPGDVFDAVINGELQRAAVVVVLWSPGAVESVWVRGEATYARENGALVPAKIADCAVWSPFNLLETSDLRGWAGDRADLHWRRFVDAIHAKRRAAVAREAPRIVRPPEGSVRTIDCAGVPLDVVWVPPGTFWMGATSIPGGRGYDALAWKNEGPPREVQIERGFWLGRHPVTVRQYQAFCAATGHPPTAALGDRHLSAPDLPVTMVDWDDARAFCGWLTAVDGLHGSLPTEAEWEWAARGPDARRYPWGPQPPDPTRAVWLGGYGAPDQWGAWEAVSEGDRAIVKKVWKERGPARVGGRPAGCGPFGAEDQSGNVWEWCADPWDDASAALRVIRGGSWDAPAPHLRAACRHGYEPDSRHRHLGVRVLLRPAG